MYRKLIRKPYNTYKKVRRGKVRKYGRRDKYDQSIFYACVEISQQNLSFCAINMH
jgi:hypothetical protein